MDSSLTPTNSYYNFCMQLLHKYLHGLFEVLHFWSHGLAMFPLLKITTNDLLKYIESLYKRYVSKVLVEGIKSLLVLNNSQEFFQCIQLPLRYLHVLLGVHPFWVKNPVILAHLKVKKGINSEFSLYK